MYLWISPAQQFPLEQLMDKPESLLFPQHLTLGLWTPEFISWWVFPISKSIYSICFTRESQSFFFWLREVILRNHKGEKSPDSIEKFILRSRPNNVLKLQSFEYGYTNDYYFSWNRLERNHRRLTIRREMPSIENIKWIVFKTPRNNNVLQK